MNGDSINTHPFVLRFPGMLGNYLDRSKDIKVLKPCRIIRTACKVINGYIKIMVIQNDGVAFNS